MRKVVIIALRLMVTVLLMELTLHVASLASDRVDFVLAEYPQAVSAAIDDPTLGHRPNPEYPGHDPRGFRNREAHTGARIVALGDSQTYGAGVERSEAWPQQLERATGLATYNYAFGGYGPTHSVAMLNEALALAPDIVIEAFYSGNDLFDCFSFVYEKGLAPELVSTDATLLAEFEELQRSSPLTTTVAHEFLGPSRGRTRTLLARYSKTWALARAFARVQRTRSTTRNWNYWVRRASESDGAWQALDSDSHRTILTPRYRLAALDMEDARIVEGQRLALESLRRIANRAPRQFLVALIPTKELVFAEITTRSGAASSDYEKLIGYERRHREEAKAFLDAHGIDYVDTLPALTAAVADGLPIYRATIDGHPSQVGQAIISDRIHEVLEGRGWLAVTGAALDATFHRESR